MHYLQRWCTMQEPIKYLHIILAYKLKLIFIQKSMNQKPNFLAVTVKYSGIM